MPSLRTDDGRTLAWRQLGAGPVLVCHPGGPGGSSIYFGDLPLLAAQRTLVLLDPRGTGGSDRPADPGEYDLEDYVADIEALRVHLGLERIDLLGHSHGGFVAMAWAAEHPDRVDRLVLASTAPRFTDVIRGRRAERVASHQGQPYFADALAALQRQQAGEYTSDAELAALLERAGPLFAPVGADTGVMAGVLSSSGITADAIKHFNERIAATMDLRPGLGRVQAPTLVIAGEDDAFGGATQEDIAAALPRATLVTLPGADHFVFLEPEHAPAFERAVLDFLAR
jgi:pimeloyl-ACP methyl ester carboxylesterase